MRTRMRRAISNRLLNRTCVIHLNENRIFWTTETLVKKDKLHNQHGIWSSHFIICNIYIMPFVLTNPGESTMVHCRFSWCSLCVSEHSSGERKLPEYAYSQITTKLKKVFTFLRSPHKLKKFYVGECRYHITTGTREVFPVVTLIRSALKHHSK